ncbi:MAG: hypothetical protein WC685_08900 [Methylobacter sp.]
MNQLSVEAITNIVGRFADAMTKMGADINKVKIITMGNAKERTLELLIPELKKPRRGLLSPGLFCFIEIKSD